MVQRVAVVVLTLILGRLVQPEGSRPTASGPRRGVSDEQLIDELARTLWEPDQARAFLWRLGFPTEHIPKFHTPETFWSMVVNAIRHGAIEGKTMALAKAARLRFPGNDVFARYRSQS